MDRLHLFQWEKHLFRFGACKNETGLYHSWAISLLCNKASHRNQNQFLQEKPGTNGDWVHVPEWSSQQKRMVSVHKKYPSLSHGVLACWCMMQCMNRAPGIWRSSNWVLICPTRPFLTLAMFLPPSTVTPRSWFHWRWNQPHSTTFHGRWKVLQSFLHFHENVFSSCCSMHAANGCQLFCYLKVQIDTRNEHEKLWRTLEISGRIQRQRIPQEVPSFLAYL